MLPNTSDRILYAVIVIGTIFWLVLIYWAGLRIAAAASNPQYIPLLPYCTTYTKHCGAEAKRVVRMYGQICREWNWEYEVCDVWWNPEEISLLLSK